MNSKRKLYTVLTIYLSLILLLFSILVGGCAREANTETIIQGWVSADSPVSGASLAIYNIKGKQIYQSDKLVTNELGSFMIAVKNFPADFRIVANGGILEGQVFTSELSADYRGFTSPLNVIHINPVTTIISTYLDEHTDKTLNEAAVAVKSFLEIPGWLDIGSGLDSSGKYFSYDSFFAETVNSGGLSQFITQLVTEMDSNSTTHPFPGSANQSLPDMGDGAAQFVTGYVLDKVASGALSWAGGQILGWGLKMFGLGSDTPDEMKQLADAMNDIKKKLDDISTQLSDVEARLEVEMKKLDYDIRVDQMGELISQIKSIKDTMNTLYANQGAPSAWIESTRQGIIKSIEDNIKGKEYLIPLQLSNEGGQRSLIKVWAQVVTSGHRYMTGDTYDEIAAQFNYFDLLQQWIVELMVEYYHSKGNETEDFHPLSDDIMNKYQTNIQAQKALLLQQIPESAFVDTQTGKMWMQKPIFNCTGAEYKKIGQIGQSETDYWNDIQRRDTDFVDRGGPLWFVYGGLQNLHVEKANPDSPLNSQVTYTYAGSYWEKYFHPIPQYYFTPSQRNFGFSDWVLPMPADLAKLVDSYHAARATEEWFVPQGAFPAGSTLENIWGNSGGNVWSGDWEWAPDLASEIVKMNVIGVRNYEYRVQILKEGSAQIGSLFPCRVITPNEHYFLNAD